jgi:hypothetical protein
VGKTAVKTVDRIVENGESITDPLDQTAAPTGGETEVIGVPIAAKARGPAVPVRLMVLRRTSSSKG